MYIGLALFCAGLILATAAAFADPAATPVPTPLVIQATPSAQPVIVQPAPARAEPRDPLYVVPGETRMDGLPMAALDTAGGGFDLRVCSYASGHGARVWLAAPRDKHVEVDRKTILYAFGAQSSQISLSDVDAHSYHITVIGEDGGRDNSLLARVVWIQKGSLVESTFVQRFHEGKTPRSCNVPDVRVTRPFVYTMGRNFPVALVQIKLSSVRVRVGLAWGHVGATESLGGIVHDYDAIAAINGSFFDAYNSSRYKSPNNELICMSEPVFRADIGTVLGFTPDGEARMARSPVADALHRLDVAYPDRMGNNNLDQTLLWQRVPEGLGAGPRLVRDGQVSLDPYGEGFHSAEVLNGVAMRSAVGINSTGWLLMVTTQASIPQLAHIMKALGCSQAMNLDGGSSSGLWARGRYLRRPARYLSNALVIVHR